MRLAYAAAALALVVPLRPAAAQAEPAITLTQVRASVAGQWRGELQYLDYQSGDWVGIPVAIDCAVVGDGNTIIRRAQFDDGPRVGAVFITTLAMLSDNGTTEYVTSFRVGRTPEIGTYAVTLTAAADATHWTLRAEQQGMDDNRPARIRETTTRDGASLVTLKEVDFLDDEAEQWFSRNRTVLELAAA